MTHRQPLSRKKPLPVGLGKPPEPEPKTEIIPQEAQDFSNISVAEIVAQTFRTPVKDVADISLQQFEDMDAALGKARDGEPLTEHEEFLVKEWWRISKTFGEKAIKARRNQTMIEGGYEALPAAQRNLLDFMYDAVRQRMIRKGDDDIAMIDEQSPILLKMSMLQGCTEQCERCGAMSPELLEIYTTAGSSTSGDIGSWNGKGTFNVGTTTHEQCLRVCPLCHRKENPPRSQEQKDGEAGCLWIIGIIIFIIMAFVVIHKL